jgi:hypothetical protein
MPGTRTLKELVMRKIILLMSLLVVFALAGCNLGLNTPAPKPAVLTPTKSGDQMQTEISQMLTAMPTGTGQAEVLVTQTPALPTVAVATETPTPESAEGGQPVVATSTATQAVPPPPTEAAQVLPTATTAAAVAPTATLEPTSGPTATPSPGDPRSWLGNPDATDYMDDPNTWSWPLGSDAYTLGRFRNGRQTVKALTTKDGWRLANPIPFLDPNRDPYEEGFSSLYLEATFKVNDCHSDSAPMADHYGLIVRVPYRDEPNQGYLFGFNCNGQYSLRAWDWNGMEIRRQDMQMLVDWTPAVKDNKNLINIGPNTTNVMGIMTIGSRLRLYANGNFLAEYDFSNNYNIPQIYSGYFGVFVGSRTDTQFTISVDQMSYWENPHP